MDKWLYRISIAMSILGLLAAIYLTIYKVTSNDAMCLGSGDCSTVNASRYSEVNGIPVGLIGVFGYLAILAIHYLERGRGYFEQNGSLLIFGMALTGFIFTVWLIYVEFALLKAVCPFCLISQIAMTIIFGISVIRLIRQPQS
ncbi:MAG: vitamin K epoxide reductase family protein [Anaerolineales bacterium]|nr:vitamin K epoxide reductase family protein [Anaerolineales bacterium]